MASLMTVIFALAWGTLAGSARFEAVLVLVVASALAVAGVGLSAMAATSRRGAGWTFQAASIALLGFGWLLAVAG
jgi:hypothetical protein